MARPYPQELTRYRNTSAVNALLSLSSYAKRDITFVPIQNIGTERWHANADGVEFELLLNGPKFFDTRAKVGGGGAIDLALHLYPIRFSEAIALLRKRGL